MPMACQVLFLSLRVFMGREILIAHRAEVNGLVAHAYGVLFARPCAFCQNDSRLLTATYGSRAIRTLVVVSLEGLEPKLPAPAEIAFGFACITHEDAAVMCDGLDSIGHCRHRIDFGNAKVAHCLI